MQNLTTSKILSHLSKSWNTVVLKQKTTECVVHGNKGRMIYRVSSVLSEAGRWWGKGTYWPVFLFRWDLCAANEAVLCGARCRENDDSQFLNADCLKILYYGQRERVWAWAMRTNNKKWLTDFSLRLSGIDEQKGTRCMLFKTQKSWRKQVVSAERLNILE